MPSKTILITGCSSGIGLCVAHGLRRRGHRVFATARKPDDVGRLRRDGFESIELDLSESGSIEAAVTAALDRTGGTLDALFNNGAYGQPGAVEDLSRVALREQFEANVFGTQELTNHVLPIMRRQGQGRIIQNSSILGFIAIPYRGAYTASKFALEALSDTLRMELQGTGIHVSLIEPGPITSRFRDNAYAAFRRHIQPDNSAHRETYRSVEQRLADGTAEPMFNLPPEAVLKRVIHALESPRPRIRYYVTVPTYLFAVLKRLLPHQALDWTLRQASGNGRN